MSSYEPRDSIVRCTRTGTLYGPLTYNEAREVRRRHDSQEPPCCYPFLDRLEWPTQYLDRRRPERPA